MNEFCSIFSLFWISNLNNWGCRWFSPISQLSNELQNLNSQLLSLHQFWFSVIAWLPFIWRTFFKMIGLWIDLTKYLKLDKVRIDNDVFRLHYKLTFLLLLGSSIILTLKDFFGHPIHCINPHPKTISQEFLDNYCWITSTYSVHSDDKEVKGMIYGLLPDPVDDKDEKKHYNYYQWVSLALLIQVKYWEICNALHFHEIFSGRFVQFSTKTLETFGRRNHQASGSRHEIHPGRTHQS